MYSCKIHGWSSRDGQCPACQPSVYLDSSTYPVYVGGGVELFGYNCKTHGWAQGHRNCPTCARIEQKSETPALDALVEFLTNIKETRCETMWFDVVDKLEPALKEIREALKNDTK